ncbi:MAG TPA: acyl-CoA dehydrogenase family protein [Candidatus Angelobacter sp.]|jgi:alkylation response protein AidB-like acyl-CoA dehydrogenase|nr:acyl-CoA dehydrogenase family protein [Candidatus Angelobacter sp.]
MATVAVPNKTKLKGGSFLIEEYTTEQVFTLEDLSEEHKQIVQTTQDFAKNEILPNAEKIEHKEFAVTRELIRKACEIGIGNVDIPEAYGGSDMDKIASAIIAEHISVNGSFSVAFGGHVGIGTLPIVYFGTTEQKQKYLPKLASGEWIAAYALSESTSASDAMNPRTKAVLSPDGKEWILNGEKMWITNGGFADVYIIFAKVDGEKFSAFIVERTSPGFQNGAEEKKMGIRGSSTTPIILNDCRVPKENLLGEIGKGHIIAFNTLNIGRYKLGAGVVGGARNSLNNAIGYAKQRKAFGKTLSEFGMIKEKIANMAASIFTGEAMSYRTVGMIDAAMGEIDKNSPDVYKQTAKNIEEYAVECSILKVFGSEMLDYVVDETVQIYGGYGFVEEYPAERAYRDSRVNRIFEGTNEINRMIITGWLLKRAMSGQLALMPAIKKLMDEIMSGPSTAEPLEGSLAAERTLVANAKKAALMLAGAASQKYMMAIADQQEILAAIADMVIDIFAMDSVVLRTQKFIERQGEARSQLAIAMTQVSLAKSMDSVEASARKVAAAVAEGDMLRTQLVILRRLFKYEPFNTIALTQQIANRVLEAGKYVTA